MSGRKVKWEKGREKIGEWKRDVVMCVTRFLCTLTSVKGAHQDF